MNCCEIQSKFDEKDVKEENTKLMLSSITMELEKVKNKFEKISSEKKKLEEMYEQISHYLMTHQFSIFLH